MKRLLAMLLVISLVLLCGCETMKGVGKDVEKAGEWVQKKAN